MAKNIAGVEVLVGRNGEEWKEGDQVRVRMGGQVHQGRLEFVPAGLGKDPLWVLRLATFGTMGPVFGSEIEGRA